MTDDEKKRPLRSGKAGFQPQSSDQKRPSQDWEKKGHQPPSTGKPQGQNPPSGGSNVKPPPKQDDGKKK